MKSINTPAKLLLLSAIILVSNIPGSSYALPDEDLPVEEGENHRYAEQAAGVGTADADPIADDPGTQHSIAHRVLLYIPNRIVDLLDIFRVRVRVGPGVAADVRATKYASAFVGAYASTYVGLPGPRMRRIPRSPIGFETLNGAQLSVLDATAAFDLGPEYSPSEFGAGLHLGIVGVDLGIDPVEIADFLVGFGTFDPRNDEF